MFNTLCEILHISASMFLSYIVHFAPLSLFFTSCRGETLRALICWISYLLTVCPQLSEYVVFSETFPPRVTGFRIIQHMHMTAPFWLILKIKKTEVDFYIFTFILSVLSPLVQRKKASLPRQSRPVTDTPDTAAPGDFSHPTHIELCSWPTSACVFMYPSTRSYCTHSSSTSEAEKNHSPHSSQELWAILLSVRSD